MPSNGYFSFLHKMLEKHLWNSFFYLVVEILQLVREIAIKEVFWKFTDKLKKQSSGGVLSREKLFLKILQNSQKNIFAGVFFNKVADWKPETFRSCHWRCSVKQGVLKKFANVTGKNLCWSLFLIKLQFWGPATLLKKTPTQVFSCEICKLFKNNCFEEHLWKSTSRL